MFYWKKQKKSSDLLDKTEMQEQQSLLQLKVKTASPFLYKI